MRSPLSFAGQIVGFCLLVVTGVALSTSCTQTSPRQADGPSASPDAGADASADADAARPIKLMGRSWTAGELNNQIAKILLTEKLGLTVEIVPYETDDVIPPLSRGEVHVDLEVWPDSTITEALRQGTAEDGGPLGPVGKIGWYVPSYVLDQYPEFATWEGLKGPSAAVAFATAQSGGKGTFVGGDPEWGTYDEQIVKNLGLNLTVSYAGSEEGILKELDTAYAKRRPILFYMWLPHWAFTKYELTSVSLPPFTEECYSKYDTGGIDCDYETSVLQKAFWPGLKDYSPKAHAFLKKFRYSTKDQIELLARVHTEQASVEATARYWIDSHEAVWSEWLPKE